MTITFPTIEENNVTNVKFFPPQCSSLNNYDNFLYLTYDYKYNDDDRYYLNSFL